MNKNWSPNTPTWMAMTPRKAGKRNTASKGALNLHDTGFRGVPLNLALIRYNCGVDMLRSNFIGGVKHMPVTYTAGARRNPAPLAAV